MLKKITTVFAFALFVAAQMFAQSFEKPLPRYLTPEEKLQLSQNPPQKMPSAGLTDPPAWPVRTMAEWEELQALVITWTSFTNILSEIVRAARLETNVIICCSSQSVVDQAKNTLTSKGIDISSNVTFLVAPANTIWVRDYGPNCVYANEVDSLLIIDWIYNRPRPQDDALPEKVAQHLNLPLYSTSDAPTDLVHTGGNFMSDGMGIGFSSKLVLEENGPGNSFGQSNHSEAEVDDIMRDFMGIHTYPKMNTLPFDGIHHIDMHMKLLDEQTLLVGKYPTGVADGPQIEANIQYVLSNYKTSFGTPFKVVRIPMPPEGNAYPNTGGDYRTYSNAVFVNKTVIVPFYAQQYDTTAQRIWEEAMPGYKIVGINCNQIIPSLGAIHCITKEIGVNDPLRIVHKPLDDVEDNAVPGYPVFGTIQHRSGIASGKVHYTTDLSAAWQTLDMEKVPGDTQNVWQTMIPVQPEGSTVYYYIEGTANSGKIGLRPMPAPAGHWKFRIKSFSGADEPTPLRLDEIFPNPASAITCIPVFAERKAAGTVRLLNPLGQIVEILFEGDFPAGESKVFLHADRHPAGLYFVELNAEGQKLMKQLVIE